MLRRLLVLAAPLALPAWLVAQTPATPSTRVSTMAKAGAVHGTAKHRRGEVARAEDADHDRDDRAKGEDKDRDRDDRGRNANAATPAIPAVPAKPAHGEGPATPAKPAIPAVPAHKAGGGSHRP